MSEQPKYSDLEIKRDVRVKNVSIYREKTGLDSILHQYWTLCNDQTSLLSEINQLSQLGFLTKDQFHGVDLDEELIENNKKCHPTAKWHPGSWVDVIQNNDFNPSMIYLDSTAFLDGRVLMELVQYTMFKCPKGCLLLINALLNDPRSRKVFDPYKFLLNLSRKVNPAQLNKWNRSIDNYDYNATGKSNMLTLVLHKERTDG